MVTCPGTVRKTSRTTSSWAPSSARPGVCQPEQPEQRTPGACSQPLPLLHEAGGGPGPHPLGPQQVGHSGLGDNEDEGEGGEEEEEEEETSQRVMWSWRL